MRLPPEYRVANEEFKFLDETHTIKTLGVVWNPSSDKFTFTVSHLSNDLNEATITKRKVLSDIAKIFDPLGWLSPVSLELKHLMQQVWQCRVDWDQKLPTELTTAYLDWRRKLEALKDIQLQRFCLSKEQSDEVALHVFCDASEKGFAACIYVVAENDDGEKTSMLLAAKSSVAPLKVQSIPRLELCGAILGQRLLSSVLQGLSKLKLAIVQRFAWTDSTIVLSWLKQEPNHWTTFVANRVAEIQQDSELDWRHFPTHENPADIASRGLNPSLLAENELRWSGSKWLKTGQIPEPYHSLETKEECKKTAPSTQVLLARTTSNGISSEGVIDLAKQNSLMKAIGIVAFIRRFINRLRKNLNQLPMYITREESSDARKILLRQEQQKFFEEEIRTLEKDVQVKKTSRLVKLYPFFHEGVLCVGGRLVHATLADEANYPRIVPAESHLAELIIKNSHRITLHGGTNKVIAHIRQHFWIPASKDSRPEDNHELYDLHPNLVILSWGYLPKQRVDIPNRAFQDVGLNFAGLFLCKGPNRTSTQSYLALFICFASRAVHLEAVSNLTFKTASLL